LVVKRIISQSNDQSKRFRIIQPVNRLDNDNNRRLLGCGGVC
jgi:hypothetical protein